MEKLLANDLLKLVLIFGGGAIAMLLVMTRLVARVKGTFRPYQKSTLIYLLVFLVFFAVIAITSFFFNKNQAALIFIQAYFLLLGCFHVFFSNKKLTWVGEEKVFIPEVLFTLLIACFGCITFILFYNWINKDGRQYLLLPGAIFFIVPFFFYHAFKRAFAIPAKIMKQWFYPIGEEIDEPEDSKMKNMIVISFEFEKQMNDSKATNFRAKAPRDMEVGQLFYYFINDYNLMHTNSKIEYANGSGEAYGWIFYKKPNWHTVATSYIDAERTIFTNKIHENDVIICSRTRS